MRHGRQGFHQLIICWRKPKSRWQLCGTVDELHNRREGGAQPAQAIIYALQYVARSSLLGSIEDQKRGDLKTSDPAVAIAYISVRILKLLISWGWIGACRHSFW